MYIGTRKSKRLLTIVAALSTFLLAACQITLEPAGKRALLWPQKHALKLARRQQTDDEVSVRDAVARYHAALNAIFTGDLEPMAAVWSHADDVTYMGPDGAYRQGWDAVQADWVAQAAMNLGGSVEFKILQLMIEGQIAVVNHSVQGTNIDADGNPVDVSLRATVILRKEAGEWKVIGVHTDPLPFLQN